MKKIIYISLIALLCGCNQQANKQTDNSSQDSAQIVKEEIAVADSVTDEEMVQRMNEQEEWIEDAAQLDAEWEANEAAKERAKNEEMLSKLHSIEEQINNIKYGEFYRSMQSVFYYRDKGTDRLNLDYAFARKDVKDCCNELIELFQSAMSICREYDRMDLYNVYAGEIAKINDILNQL